MTNLLRSFSELHGDAHATWRTVGRCGCFLRRQRLVCGFGRADTATGAVLPPPSCTFSFPYDKIIKLKNIVNQSSQVGSAKLQESVNRTCNDGYLLSALTGLESSSAFLLPGNGSITTLTSFIERMSITAIDSSLTSSLSLSLRCLPYNKFL